MKIEKYIRHPKRNNGVVDKTKFEIRVKLNGKLRSKSIDRNLGIREARRIRSEMLTEMSKPNYVDPTKMTLTALVNDYIKTQIPTDRQSSAQAYKYNFDSHIKKSFLANMRIDKITPYHINQVLNELESRKYSGNYIKNIFAIVSASMNYAERMRLIPHESPTKNIKTPTATRKEVKLWSQNQFDQFITESKEITSLYSKLNQYHGYNYSYVIFCDFIQSVGCRISEALGLTWDNYDRENKQLTFSKTVKAITGMPFPVVEDTKNTKSYRTIPLTPRTISILDEIFENRVIIDFENPYIFNLKGKPYYPNSLSRTFDQLTKQLNMPTPFALKDTRKVFITEAIKNGVPVVDVADYVGNTPEMIWRVYARSTESSQLELIEKISGNNA